MVPKLSVRCMGSCCFSDFEFAVGFTSQRTSNHMPRLDCPSVSLNFKPQT